MYFHCVGYLSVMQTIEVYIEALEELSEVARNFDAPKRNKHDDLYIAGTRRSFIGVIMFIIIIVID